MVGLGTIFGVLIAGTVAVGSYALYVNRDKLGGALSRGVEKNISNPLGAWFDNAWSGVTNPTKGTGLSKTTPQPTTTTTLTKSGFTQTPLLTPQGLTQQQVLQKAPNLIPVQTTLARTPAYRPSTAYKAGYYYFDVKGRQYDTQQYKTAAQIKQIRSIDPKLLYNPEGLRAITYIGKSKLGAAGFELFGKSQNYL